MARGVGKGQPGARGKRFDAALALAHVFEQIQPVRVTEPLRDFGEAGKYALFRAA